MNAPQEKSVKNKLLKGETGDWNRHRHGSPCQVLSNSKLFSGASTQFGAEPNSQVSFIDAGFPACCRSSNEKCVDRRSAPGWG